MATTDRTNPFEDEALMDWAAQMLRRGLRRRQAAQAENDREADDGKAA